MNTYVIYNKKSNNNHGATGAFKIKELWTNKNLIYKELNEFSTYEELFKKALPKRKKLQEAVYGMIESDRVERLPALSAPEPTIQAFIKEEKKRLKPLVTSLPEDQLSSPNLENFFVQALMECWR